MSTTLPSNRFPNGRAGPPIHALLSLFRNRSADNSAIAKQISSEKEKPIKNSSGNQKLWQVLYIYVYRSQDGDDQHDTYGKWIFIKKYINLPGCHGLQVLQMHWMRLNANHHNVIGFSSLGPTAQTYSAEEENLIQWNGRNQESLIECVRKKKLICFTTAKELFFSFLLPSYRSIKVHLVFWLAGIETWGY